MVSGSGMTTVQRSAIGTLVVFTVATGITVGSRLLPARRGPAQRSECTHITLQAATSGTPYGQMAKAIKASLDSAGEKWTTDIRYTTGSVQALGSLGDLNATTVCTIAIAQLNVAADAYLGVGDFGPAAYSQPQARIPDLATVGPLYDDVVQLVTTSAGITSIADLCGKNVEVGAEGSGTLEVSNLLFNVTGLRGNCDRAGKKIKEDSETFQSSLGKLGNADTAMIWSSATPALDLQNFINNNNGAHFIDLSGFVGGFESNFRNSFSSHGPGWSDGRRFFDKVPVSYDGVKPVWSVGIPNGIVSRKDADPVLVRFIAGLIAKPDKKFIGRLAVAGFPIGRTSLSGAQALSRDRVFCLVPLQSDAKQYYLSNKIDIGSCS